MNVNCSFGQPMSNCNYTSGAEKYRFGFNGQEKDDEVAGAGNTNTAMFWEYDTRLGRRWNLDPKPNPSISDYACFANNPIEICDPNGDSTWTTQKGNQLTINTTIEFSGNGLYKKNGKMRKDAEATVEKIKKDIMDKWDNTKYQGMDVSINLITKTSKNGGTESSYDQIKVYRGRGRSSVRATDKNGVLITTANQSSIIRSVLAGSNYLKMSGTFYKNEVKGAYAHEYGHMIGYLDEDYEGNDNNILGVPEPKAEFMRGGIMHTVRGVPLEHHFLRIFQMYKPTIIH